MTQRWVEEKCVHLCESTNHLCPLLPTSHLFWWWVKTPWSFQGYHVACKQNPLQCDENMFLFSHWKPFTEKWNYFQKRKTSTQGESGTKRKKVSQKQTQSVSPSGSNTSTTAGFPPLPQTSPSASSSTQLPKVHISCFSFPSFLQLSYRCVPQWLLFIWCITLWLLSNLFWQRWFLRYAKLVTLVRSHIQVKPSPLQMITLCNIPGQNHSTTSGLWRWIAWLFLSWRCDPPFLPMLPITHQTIFSLWKDSTANQRNPATVEKGD